MVILNIFPAFLERSFGDWLKEFFHYLLQGIVELFVLDLGEYENLDLSVVAIANLRGAIIAVFLGIIIASILTLFHKNVHGDFVRSLISEDCSSPEKAKTLYDLGFMTNGAVKSALRSGNTYRGIVRCVEEDAYNASVEKRRGEYRARADQSGERTPEFKSVPYKIDFNKDHFYIPEEVQFTAGTRFEKQKGSVGTVILVVVISAVMLVVTLKLLPDLLQLVDNFVGSFKSSSGY